MEKWIDTLVILSVYLVLKFGFVFAALLLGLGIWGIYDGLRDIFLEFFSK